jgi:excinuclease UvrABC nuclease subunit
MSESIESLLTRRWDQFADDLRQLLSGRACTLGEALAPRESGIYVLFDEHTTLTYAGMARDLCDRFHKHISGDESHAIQRALAERFTDRTERRKFIKENVQASWRVVSGAVRLADLERLVIWLYQPSWNRR